MQESWMIGNDVETMPLPVLSITVHKDSGNGDHSSVGDVALSDNSCVLPEVVVGAGSVTMPC